MRRKVLALLVLLVSAASRAAAGDAATAAARLLTDSVPPGGRALVKVTLTPTRGARLYRDKVEVELAGATPARLGKFSLPAGERKFDKSEQKEIEIFTKPASFDVPVLVPGDYSGDKLDFALRVHFMGCTDRICFPPESQKFDFTVQVSGKAVKPPDTETSPPAAVETSAPQTAPPREEESSYQRLLARGGFFAILGAFLAGLLVAFTPCVYPMIPVTVALIGGAAAGKDGARKKSLLLLYTLIYVLGISITYVVLGIIATFSNRAIGSLANSPWLLGVVGLVMAALALSMFGAYDLALPAALTNRLGRLQGAGSLPMLLVSGLVMGLVVSPCVSAPLLAVLAVVGKTGNVVLGALSLFAFAWGMSALLIIAGLFPGLMGRPGPWMVHVKAAFGVIMAALGLYFVKDLIPLGFYGWIGLLIALGLGLALVLAARKLTEGTRKRGLVAGIGGISLVLAAYLGLGWSVRTGALADAVDFVLPAGVTAEAPGREGREVQWQPYTAEAFDRAGAEGKPVVIDFYASWCTSCKTLDRALFRHGRAVEEMERFVRLRVDGSDTSDKLAQAAKERFEGDYPTVIVFDGQGKEIGRFWGTATPGPFLEKLREAR